MSGDVSKRLTGSAASDGPTSSAEGLLEKIKKLRRTKVRETVEHRIKEFEDIRKRNNRKEIFKELCYCILTANYTAERALMLQNKIGNGFYTLGLGKLRRALKRLGHRFPNSRAEYIVGARKNLNELIKMLRKTDDERALREWLVKNIRGLGYKESSHFLRNIGYKNVAIIDFHIINLLVENGLIPRPGTNSLTKKTYLAVEEKLSELAKKAGLNLAELDLYLWYLETGKVLK